MTDAFEARLRASLRHGASQADDIELGWLMSPLRPGLEDDLRASLHDAAQGIVPVLVHTPVRARRRVVAPMLAAAAVLVFVALIGVMLATPKQPQTPPAGTIGVPAPVPTWTVVVSLRPIDSSPLVAHRTDVTRSDPARLHVEVRPTLADGKTYLEQLIDGRWVRRGPHNTDVTSREIFALSIPPRGTTHTYRVHVPAVAGRADGFSAPVSIAAAA